MSCTVTEVVSYRCDGCGRTYPSRAPAERCAARGEPTAVPPGCCVSDGPIPGAGLPYALAVVTELGARDGHAYLPNVFDFRDQTESGQARRLGDSTQHGGPPVGDLTGRTVPVDTSSPRYARAWDHFQALGIPLTLIVDGAAVPGPPQGTAP